jgi:spore germination protein KA
MNGIKKIALALGFTRKRSEFELLETEKGAPGFFGGWRYAEEQKQEEKQTVAPSFSENIGRIKESFRADINPDIIIRRFAAGGRVEAAAVFMNGMADAETINDYVLRETMKKPLPDKPPYIDYMIKNVLTAGDVSMESDWYKVKRAITDGQTVMFVGDEERAAIIDTRGYEHRSVGTTENEKVVRGPQEGFNESLRTNITLLRRMIRREDLVCEIREMDVQNHIRAAIVYLDGSANPALVQEVKRRIAGVQTRMMSNIGVLEQLTENHPLSPFPQVLTTERPDRTASHIMQGYVAVLMDGSPFANIMPTTLFTLMSSSEDVYLRQMQGTVVRLVRYIGALISILLPGYFLSLVLYHQGMMSTEALSTVVASRKMVFAPMGLELLFLLLVFQLIREAGLRVPGSIGQAIGIIGGLILGQAAVSANLASSVMLIVVALSGLGNFCIPDYATQISASYIRAAFVIAAWIGGLLGMSCMLVAFFALMASLKSFGIPFLTPASPKTYSKRPAIVRGRITMHAKTDDYINTREGELL